MYPTFVKQKESNPYNSTRTLEICGQSYLAHTADPYIDDAISLAALWHSHQITYPRIIHLRNWIRENDQHGHSIPFKHIKDIMGCKYFVDSVIEAEFSNIGPHYQENFYASLRENERIFFE
ncbi:hypothetical protein [Chitinophaga sp. LS1]|uniref:hypothetical protein n=1 Tax=Chitinophaga sp. LS1 TaxID=3051176 RepID=UPI002AAA8D2A|nr:hypothetical protein [Chitinophaga sp. LS1]WPV66380.1 hypothetical protein QQL36_31795 [Chitinophaga sp. LS1]